MHPNYAAAPIKSSKHGFEIILSGSLMPVGTVTDAAAAAASSFERH